MRSLFREQGTGNGIWNGNGNLARGLDGVQGVKECVSVCSLSLSLSATVCVLFFISLHSVCTPWELCDMLPCYLNNILMNARAQTANTCVCVSVCVCVCV